MSMFQTPTRVWANAHPEYPGLFEIHSDSGDIALNQVATRHQRRFGSGRFAPPKTTVGVCR